MMHILTLLHEVYIFATSFFGWRDCCEIAFFSGIIYYFLTWLSTDRTKNLLVLVYSYIFTLTFSYILQLTAITFFLFYGAPFALLLLIIMHQELLQRNFITLKKTYLKKDAPSDDWLETVMQICLQTINKNKSITVLIERHDELKNFLHVPFNLSTPINTAILTLLIDNESYDDNRFILLSSVGAILGVNVECKHIIDPTWIDAALHQYEINKQKILVLSQKTDAFIISITPTTRKFLLAYDGKIIENLQAQTALQMVKKILITDLKKGFMHGSSYKNLYKQV